MNGGPGLASGALLILIGIFVVSRTVVHDAQGQNLVDRLLAIAGGGSSTPKSSSSSTSVPSIKAPTSAGNVLQDLAWIPRVGAKGIQQAAQRGLLP